MKQKTFFIIFKKTIIEWKKVQIFFEGWEPDFMIFLVWKIAKLFLSEAATWSVLGGLQLYQKRESGTVVFLWIL